jgi:hypothetical protein
MFHLIWNLRSESEHLHNCYRKLGVFMIDEWTTFYLRHDLLRIVKFILQTSHRYVDRWSAWRCISLACLNRSLERQRCLGRFAEASAVHHVTQCLTSSRGNRNPQQQSFGHSKPNHGLSLDIRVRVVKMVARSKN